MKGVSSGRGVFAAIVMARNKQPFHCELLQTAEIFLNVTVYMSANSVLFSFLIISTICSYV